SDDGVFLVPVEGERENKGSLIPLQWLYDRLAACKARQKVLILDVCRFNPARGLERPGSGPMTVEEGKPEGAMGPKLDAMLREPPDGVQVWSACIAEQHSLEFDDGNLNNGAFLEVLSDVASRGVEGVIQKENDLIPVEKLVDKVNEKMKALIL